MLDRKYRAIRLVRSEAVLMLCSQIVMDDRLERSETTLLEPRVFCDMQQVVTKRKEKKWLRRKQQRLFLRLQSFNGYEQILKSEWSSSVQVCRHYLAKRYFIL